MDATKCNALISSLDLGSFSAAAKALGYTPSGITRMIDALEAEVGFPLVNRLRNGITPTREGEQLLPKIRAIAQVAQSLGDQAQSFRGVHIGEVRVGTYSSIAAHWLPGIIYGFRERYPGVAISLVEEGNATLSHLLRERKIDCAFTSARIRDGEWIPLLKDPLLAWIPQSWSEAQTNTFPLKQIAKQPFILPLPGTDNDVENLFIAHNMQANVVMTANDNYTTWRLVEAGLGMSANNKLMSQGWEGDVATIPFDPPQFTELGIAVLSMEMASPATNVFVEFAQQQIAEMLE